MLLRSACQSQAPVQDIETPSTERWVMERNIQKFKNEGIFYYIGFLSKTQKTSFSSALNLITPVRENVSADSSSMNSVVHATLPFLLIPLVKVQICFSDYSKLRIMIFFHTVKTQESIMNSSVYHINRLTVNRLELHVKNPRKEKPLLPLS